MIHTYKITGMTCSSCATKVRSALLSLSDITSVEVSLEQKTAVISMDKHVPLFVLQTAIGGSESKYQISAE